jgi:hypothetical protein
MTVNKHCPHPGGCSGCCCCCCCSVVVAVQTLVSVVISVIYTGLPLSNCSRRCKISRTSFPNALDSRADKLKRTCVYRMSAQASVCTAVTLLSWHTQSASSWTRHIAHGRASVVESTTCRHRRWKRPKCWLPSPASWPIGPSVPSAYRYNYSHDCARQRERERERERVHCATRTVLHEYNLAMAVRHSRATARTGPGPV